jgi:hypothetical protein
MPVAITTLPFFAGFFATSRQTNEVQLMAARHLSTEGKSQPQARRSDPAPPNLTRD